MRARKIDDGVYWMGAVDWDRRLFDALIPLPDGTSYNAYLIQGSEKTALIDTVDPSMRHILAAQLADVPRLDYVISHHAEPDHSGALPMVFEKYPQAQVVTSTKGKGMLVDHLAIPEDRTTTVADGEVLSLGDKTLKFIYTPWVHWPETMVSYLPERKILFTCDFFGSHLATSELYADEARVYEPAKRYFAEIMMPFGNVIQKNLEKIAGYDIETIAPSHGPIYKRPAFIIDAYREWVAGPPKNLVLVPYVSMWGSTQKLVERLVAALTERGVAVEQFDLVGADLGKLAMSLVDAATLVLGTPTVLVGAHPQAAYAAVLANALKPKLKFVSLVGSYGWAGKVAEQILALIPNLKVEVIDPVLCKGLPREADLQAVDRLAQTIADKHKTAGIG
jgi:flavorubredoxin